jgi:hypothetical protein
MKPIKSSDVALAVFLCLFLSTVAAAIATSARHMMSAEAILAKADQRAMPSASR